MTRSFEDPGKDGPEANPEHPWPTVGPSVRSPFASGHVPMICSIVNRCRSIDLPSQAPSRSIPNITPGPVHGGTGHF